MKFLKNFISIDTVVLNCSNMGGGKCKKSGFRELKAEDVKITLDLKKNEYIFRATCPVCGGRIYNSRKAFI